MAVRWTREGSLEIMEEANVRGGGRRIFSEIFPRPRLMPFLSFSFPLHSISLLTSSPICPFTQRLWQFCNVRGRQKRPRQCNRCAAKLRCHVSYYQVLYVRHYSNPSCTIRLCYAVSASWQCFSLRSILLFKKY